MTMNERKQQLLNLKQDLQNLREISEDARAPVMLDPQSVGRLSRMDALQGQAMAQASERQRQLDLQRIENALHRLETGDYGYCLECDEQIPEKRLDIDPAATHCVHCARL